jgi:hypothetical protein
VLCPPVKPPARISERSRIIVFKLSLPKEMPCIQGVCKRKRKRKIYEKSAVVDSATSDRLTGRSRMYEIGVCNSAKVYRCNIMTTYWPD